MLRKRSRSVHKDQSLGHLIPDSPSDTHFPSDVVAQKPGNSSFFSVPGLLVGFTAKGLSDYESAKSPTSPLDHRVFSNLGPLLRSPRSGLEGQPKRDCNINSNKNNNKVGLGIVDALIDETKPCGRVFGISERRSILFGSQMRINIRTCQTHLLNPLDSSLTPSSLPKNYAISPLKSSNLQSNIESEPDKIRLETEEVGKIRSCLSYSDRSSMRLNSVMGRNPESKWDEFLPETKTIPQDSGSSQFVAKGPSFGNFSDMKPSSLPISVGSGHGFIGHLSASEIELSEDYTCVISHGPNPRTTHIYRNCILDSHSFELADFNKEEWGIGSSHLVKGCDDYYPSNDFLSFCFSCNKKLEDGEDIYMYRGEKAFCSSSCRAQEILCEEEMDKPAIVSSDYSELTSDDDIFLMGMAVSP